MFRFFQTKSKWFFFFVIIMGLATSFANIGMLMLINNVLAGQSFVKGAYAPLVFVVLIVMSFFTNRIFQFYMVGLTNNLTFDLELEIVQKLRNASFESYEFMGSEKIYAALGDTRMLSRIPQTLIQLMNSAITVVCALGYMFWITPLGGCIICAMMGGLLIVYLVRDRQITKDQNEVRDLQDSYYNSLRELMNGFKQIRISVLRNNNLFNRYILDNRVRAKQLTVKTSRAYVANELAGVYSWYMVLGVVIFLLPFLFGISTAQTAAFVATTLFLIGPVSQLIMFFPFYTSLKIAVERISRIDTQLRMDAVPVPEKYDAPASFSEIRFEQVVYQYDQYDENVVNSFRVEIEDLSIQKGEIIFVTGGNGSGKTTFINVLTGLCKPMSGKIYVDDHETGWESFSLLSNMMSVVYTNQHLFKNNYDDHDFTPGNSELQQMMKMINLEGIVKYSESGDWMDVNLSRGQQKRLSLILALMENKPLIILDEWAAEQDPHNRRLFYTKWLPAIRDQGKTIIAISHDDDYYHVADRVLKFNYGKIVNDHATIAVE